MPEVNVEPQERTNERVESARDSVGSRRTAMRMLRDSKGVVLVYEQDPSAKDQGPPTLVFESVRFTAHLQQFPADWRRLSDPELLAIGKSQKPTS
jgi:hypothetical protein